MTAITRRAFVAGLAGAGAGIAGARLTPGVMAAGRPRPTPSQLTWQRDELALFLHFGINTFTDREWGDGTEAPGLFAPASLDARSWAKAARAGGFRAMILTAKHHDGFCLWPSRTTRHTVASSPFRNGQGDVVQEFVEACHAEDLRPGLYLSPWDRHDPRYGDSPRYNDLYCDQLTELLTHYGAIHEVWFDGANGEGPNGKKQQYDWPRIWALVRRLQPKAVIFSDAGPDVRWIGNEQGAAGETNWSTVDPAVVPVPGMSGPAVTRMLQRGDPAGSAWRPGETDVSIRPGWFHHATEDTRVKTVDQLVSLYVTSVGRNSKLLLNVPPTRDGRLHETDAARLAGMRARLVSLFAANPIAGRALRWRQTGSRTASGEIDLRRDTPVDLVGLAEDIAQGQIVSRYTVEARSAGDWQPLCAGTTIGCCKLDRVPRTTVRHLRVTISDAIDRPRPVRVRLGLGGR